MLTKEKLQEINNPNFTVQANYRQLRAQVKERNAFHKAIQEIKRLALESLDAEEPTNTGYYKIMYQVSQVEFATLRDPDGDYRG